MGCKNMRFRILDGSPGVRGQPLALAAGSSIAYEQGKPVPNRLSGLSLPTLADSPSYNFV